LAIGRENANPPLKGGVLKIRARGTYLTRAKPIEKKKT